VSYVSRTARLSIAVYVAILVALVVRSPVRTLGDGDEYTAYAIAFVHGHGPALSEAAIADIRRDFLAIDPALAGWDIASNGHRTRDGRLEFVHFWLYSALAAPFVAAAKGVGSDPRIGFTILNIAFLAGSFAIVLRRLPSVVTWFLFVGPIIWWADKAHIEVYVFSLMSIALAVQRDRPWIALLCVGAVAAQVPVFAVFLPLIVATTALTSRTIRVDRSLWLGLAAGAAIAALPSLHYLHRFGTLTLLASASRPHWPARGELGIALWDLNLGLVPNWPPMAFAAGAAIIVARKRALSWPVITTVIGGLALLVSFAQIGNWLHGATPGVLRYAIWLIPLTIPLLAAAADHRGWRAVIALLAMISVPYCFLRYRPSVDEFSERPTWAAHLVWSRAPSWSRPIAEVFVKVQGMHWLPAATPGCEKVLLVGRGDAQGMWPRPCAPIDVPGVCREPAALCYANRRGDGYEFDRIADDPRDLRYDPSLVWPKAAEPGIARGSELAEWSSLARLDPAAIDVSAPELSGASMESMQESARARFIVLRHTRSGATIGLRATGPESGLLIDGETGEVIWALKHELIDGVWRLALPPDRPLLVIALTRN